MSLIKLNVSKTYNSKPKYCSPANEKQKYTCFTKKALINIANTYNNTNVNDNNKINIYTSKKLLHESLYNKFSKICDNEHCWISTENKDLEKKTFRPSKPCTWNVNNRSWLNSNDIYNVMSQYEDAYKNFKFIGVFPIDFNSTNELNYCISQEMCSLNIEKIYKSAIKKLGFVFNLDKHDQSGSHWVSMYICLDPNNINFGIHYYDSANNKTPKEINEFINYVSKIVNNIINKNASKNKKFEIQKNKKQHQFKNTECGMFSMYFIIECLKDIKVSSIYNSSIFDDDVAKFRNLYFKPNNYCSR